MPNHALGAINSNNRITIPNSTKQFNVNDGVQGMVSTFGNIDITFNYTTQTVTGTFQAGAYVSANNVGETIETGQVDFSFLNASGVLLTRTATAITNSPVTFGGQVISCVVPSSLDNLYLRVTLYGRRDGSLVSNNTVDYKLNV